MTFRIMIQSFYYYESNKGEIKHILLKGPIISLGFNFKRIFSWIVFELFLFFYLINKKFNIIVDIFIIIINDFKWNFF